MQGPGEPLAGGQAGELHHSRSNGAGNEAAARESLWHVEGRSEGDDRKRESQPCESSGHCRGGYGRSGGEESRIASGRGRLSGCVFDQRRRDGVEGWWKVAAGAGLSVARELELAASGERLSGGFYLQFETG